MDNLRWNWSKMDKKYKEWLQEQTFETLATDNYNVKLLLLAEQAKTKKLVEVLEEIRWYKAISKDVHKIQQIAAHAVTGIDVLENGLRGLEVNNAK